MLWVPGNILDAKQPTLVHTWPLIVTCAKRWAEERRVTACLCFHCWHCSNLDTSTDCVSLRAYKRIIKMASWVGVDSKWISWPEESEKASAPIWPEFFLGRMYDSQTVVHHWGDVFVTSTQLYKHISARFCVSQGTLLVTLFHFLAFWRPCLNQTPNTFTGASVQWQFLSTYLS